MYEIPIVKEQDGVILTIWGVYVEPSATGVICSVENYDDSRYIKIVAVDGDEVTSRLSFGGANTYAGYVGYEIVQTITATSTGEHTLTVMLNAMFAYRSQAAYENKTPVYQVVLRNAKITDGMSAVKMFEAADEITGHEETMLPVTEDYCRA